MKKVLSLVAAVFAFGVGAASAADTPIDASQVKGKITVYTNFTHFVRDGSYDRWESEFKKLYPNVEDVEVIGVTAYAKDMATRMGSGDYGDVLNILDDIPPSNYPNYFAPLDAMKLQETHQFADRYKVNGNYFGFVIGTNAEAVVYNKKAFEKAGIKEFPKTKDELFAACEKLKAAKITPMLLNMGAGWPMQQWDKAAMLFAHDGGYYNKILDVPNPFAADQPYGQAFSFVKDLFDKGCTEKDYTANNWEASKGAMATGKAGMWFLANWSIKQIVEAGEAIGAPIEMKDLGFEPLPIDNSGEAKVVISPDWALGVSKNSKNPETAKAWLYFMLYQSDLADRAGFIPGAKTKNSTLPQVTHLFASNPELILADTPSSEFKKKMAAARFDFMGGLYIRDALLAKDFPKALNDLNKRWSEAK